jgi:phenylacetic acid degradation protein
VPAYAIDAVVPVVDPTAFVHPTAVLIGDVVIGAGCYVGPGASLRGDMGRIHIGAGALIGIGATVMDGATVGDRALVGAHSFVPADMTISGGYLALGSPAREVRALSDAEIAWQANGPVVYQELAARCLASLHEADPLAALPAERGSLAVSQERAMALREFRQADRLLAAPGAHSGVDSRSSAC